MTNDDLHEQIHHYLSGLFAAEDEVLQWIRSAPERHDMPTINVQPLDGYLLGWLARMVNARQAVEIGALAGYSGTWIARALPEDGRLYTLEKSSKHADVARASFEHAGLTDKVEVLQGDALQLLDKISDRGPFDFVFIDADKESYPQYLEWAISNLRIGGMVTAHNAHRHGGVINPETESDRAMDRFNRTIAEHPNLDGIIIPMGDGMAAAVKRS